MIVLIQRNRTVPDFPIGRFLAVGTGEEVTDGTVVAAYRAGAVSAPMPGKAIYDSAARLWVWDAIPAAATDAPWVGWSFDLLSCLPISYTIKTCGFDPDAAMLPADIRGLAGEPALPSDEPVRADVVTWLGTPPAPLDDDGRLVASSGGAAVGKPPTPPKFDLPEFPANFAELAIDSDGCVRLQPGQVLPPPDPTPLPDGLRRLDVDDRGRVKVQPISVSLVGE